MLVVVCVFFLVFGVLIIIVVFFGDGLSLILGVGWGGFKLFIGRGAGTFYVLVFGGCWKFGLKLNINFVGFMFGVVKSEFVGKYVLLLLFRFMYVLF